MVRTEQSLDLMINKVFENWVPIEGLPSKGEIEGIHDDYEGFRILIRDDLNTKTLRIFFHMPLVYRRTDEGERLRTIDEFPVLQKGMFFKVKNSDLSKWLEEESCGVHEAKKLKHYFIAASNDIVDVVSEEEPVLEWL